MNGEKNSFRRIWKQIEDGFSIISTRCSIDRKYKLNWILVFFSSLTTTNYTQNNLSHSIIWVCSVQTVFTVVADKKKIFHTFDVRRLDEDSTPPPQPLSSLMRYNIAQSNSKWFLLEKFSRKQQNVLYDLGSVVVGTHKHISTMKMMCFPWTRTMTEREKKKKNAQHIGSCFCTQLIHNICMVQCSK